MKREVFDPATGETIPVFDPPTMTPDEQIAALKAALTDAMQTLGWAKAYWIEAKEGVKQ